MVLTAELQEKLKQTLTVCQIKLTKINMKINIKLSMIIASDERKHKIELEGKTVELVKCYNNMASDIEGKGKIDKEIMKRIAERPYNTI